MAVGVDLRYPSPLRYPGGKGKLTEFVKLLLLENDLCGGDYVEPYAGGASVALALLFEDYVDHIHINDVNPSVAAFWRTVTEQTDELCNRIERTPVTVAEWRRQREVQRDPAANELDLAFSTFFLNRTSRSGILGAGVIGGVNQNGRWKIDARYEQHALIRRLRKIGRFGHRISVTQIDAADLLQNHLPRGRPTFVYLDPPYYIKGAGLYENHYGHDDHAEIAAIVSNLGVPWLVSYDRVDEIETMYQRFRSISYRLSYSAHEHHHGTEVMFFSRDVRIPDVESPAGVSPSVASQLRLATAGLS